MARTNTYQNEIDRIVEIRKTNPGVGPYKLARQIRDGSYGTTGSYRPYYSTLSVIRRYDAKQKNTAKVAA